jgi:hypothetical protein
VFEGRRKGAALLQLSPEGLGAPQRFSRLMPP